MSHADTIAGLASPPAPAKERRGDPLPPRIGHLFQLLHILLDVGFHLSETLEHRAAARGFATIGQFFGTARTPEILARIMRGVLRLVALQRVLLERASCGRDLPEFKPPGERAEPRPPGEPAVQPETKEKKRRGPRPNPNAVPDLDDLPSLEEFEAEVRRRPIGRTLADICRDLGVSPAFCTREMWNALFFAIHHNHGNVGKLYLDFCRRREAFIPEWNADMHLGLPEQMPDGIRRAVGFRIGEPPAVPEWVTLPPGWADRFAQPP